jgi:hypothetical protein
MVPNRRKEQAGPASATCRPPTMQSDGDQAARPPMASKGFRRPAALAFRACVRQRTDFVPWRVRRCAMTKNRRMLWSSAVVCAMCGWRLLPLSLAPGSPDDRSAASADRPDLKCPSCGQCYEWQTSCGWVPTGNTECVASPDVYELTGHVVERRRRWRRSTPEQPIVVRDHRLR